MADYFLIEKVGVPQAPATHFLQTRLWGEFKSRYGWESFLCHYNWRDYSGDLLVLVRKIVRFLPFAYIPAGPSLKGISPEDRDLFLNRLSRELQGVLPLGTLFLRFDLTDPLTFFDDSDSFQTSSPFRKSVMDIQPPDTSILSLKGHTEEDILAGMHKKWRYNIRLAEKRGVTVKEGTLDDLSSWYSLYCQTGERDKISIHSEQYYRQLFEMASESEEVDIKLYLAEYGSELLAGNICIGQGKLFTYVYGASSNFHRNLMPAYSLQWRAIKEALASGYSYYDFFGIPPSDNPDHPMAGLYRFKMNFGGKAVHYPGCWDYPCSRLFYFIYSFAEKIRKWYYKSFKKR